MQHSTWDDDEMDGAEIHENSGDPGEDWDAFDASIRSDDAYWHEVAGVQRD